MSVIAPPLYARVLGSAWLALPEPIRRLHTPGAGMRAEGRAIVERGTGRVARIVAAVFGFPPAGDDVPVAVTFTVKDGHEIWQRDFAGKRFASEQSAGRRAHVVVERFGPFAFDLALSAGSDRLEITPSGWRLLGLPLPTALAPFGPAFETVINGRFYFHVDIRLPLIGRIVHYRGFLVPC